MKSPNIYFGASSWAHYPHHPQVKSIKQLLHQMSTLIKVMVWCRQATSHLLNQCWPRFTSPLGVTRPQIVIPTVDDVEIFSNNPFDRMTAAGCQEEKCQTRYSIYRGFDVFIASLDKLSMTWLESEQFCKYLYWNFSHPNNVYRYTVNQWW